MAKSVFISSTSKDLFTHRAVVDKAIRRLGLHPINMDDFGSQPGGASGVSVREVRKADIFVGIVAWRYGYVPEGMQKSVTEQEYDEAIKLKLPRLMYLVHPDYDWDWPNKFASENIEDSSAIDKLQSFKRRIEQHEVRSLFQTPEDLASQVTADLTKLVDKQRRQQLVTRIAIGILTLIFFISLVIAFAPEVRIPLLVSLKVITFTPTPSLTFTPTNTPTPTTTFTPSPTPMEGPIFTKDQVGVVLADFEQIGNSVDISKVQRNLEIELTDSKVPLVRIHHLFSNLKKRNKLATNIMQPLPFGEIQNPKVLAYIFKLHLEKAKFATACSKLKY